MHVQLNPTGVLNLLSQLEVDLLQQSSTFERYKLFRNCVLAVLNVGSHTDSSYEIYKKFEDFDVKLVARERGIKIELTNPPESAFVDGTIISGIHEHIFSVIRDILFICQRHQEELVETKNITHMVFDMLRNAGALEVNTDPNMVVCWGGHSINEPEYKYTKEVGYQLGLRGLNICTGCGPGAMKGPMKGATIGHAKQRITNNRYLGLTEPSIIAAEPPNPIVNELVILPDIEKRLEAFVRTAHAIIIFPGGAGTSEELLYLLGILLHPDNEKQVLPVILTGPASSAAYFDEIAKFVEKTLGKEALSKFSIIIDNPELVAQTIKNEMPAVREYRKSEGDAYYFNWTLKIEAPFQMPFEPTHENMASLDLHLDQPKEILAANLRRAFSGIVAGNVKDNGVKAIKEFGPYILDGDKSLMKDMDKLLRAFVSQGRMKLPGSKYEPCYKIES
ncbi:nucleotide 5'-monophosphate nucleosidase PpnN [Pseudoalteromonas luteoviolacea]|uniref:AMP nucleosidase n=1 Tax=Pseudoalteromonas luteoviolacea S4060-1 TaxID=1365257 RepID=A0A162BVQ8_9GAMM|nr:nucleotide 5'-monophosphate nucleosidase PpnN [Pseudoalteromonas luteoviolacea]KZN38554.1 LOG family protein ygdH [Pseudoalteromonas luteoviolacea S2607]KZN69377.1 LOG family protein ygdH [Pseudoalteromonas luteoviolacea S4060-1]